MNSLEASYCPDDGDLIWINFDPQTGREQRGRRPALSPRAYNLKIELCVVCPVTSTSKGYPFEVHLPPDLPISGVVLADHVKSLSWPYRKTEFACRVPRNVQLDVRAKLKALLAF